MEEPRRDFFFRNRRWLLVALSVAALLFLPLSHGTTGKGISTFLARVTGGSSRALWEHSLYGLAAALLALGAFWRSWGSAYLGAHVVLDKQLHSERLVADGPFRRTRNPLYFGNLLLALGFAVVVPPVTGAIIAVGMWILVRLFIRDEEAALERFQGESYRAYRTALPRLVPAWRPRVPAAGASPRWVQGICGESWVWVVAVVTVGFAATPSPRWYGPRVLVGFAIALPLSIWARRSSRQAGRLAD
jgi:protein-S-isoprenylcysteine O-methyltransferase Ste14